MTAGQVGAFAGTMAAVITGPMGIIGLGFGVALAVVVLRTTWNGGAKLLGSVLALFAAGGAAGLAKLPAVLSWQRELGLAPGFADAAAIVVRTGVAVLLVGGLLLGVGKLAAAVWRRARRITGRVS